MVYTNYELDNSLDSYKQDNKTASMRKEINNFRKNYNTKAFWCYRIQKWAFFFGILAVFLVKIF